MRSPFTGFVTSRPSGTPVFWCSSAARSSARGPGRLVDVVADRLLVLGARRQPLDLGMLGGEHEEGGAEEGVRAGGEDREVEVEVLAAEDHLGALRAADPVALHRDHVLGPGLEQLEVVEQPLRVLGDPEEPLLELPQLDERAAALAVPVDHLLVRQDGLVLRAPVDGRLAALREPALVELEEDPLRPAVVAGLVGAELARPVDRDAPAHELLAEGRDGLLGRLPRMLAGLDRVVLGRQPEGVIAHRVHDAVAAAAPEVGDGVAHRVGLQVADVRLAGGVGQHFEDVALRLRRIELRGAGVRHHPGVLRLPDELPLALDRLRVVAVRCLTLRHGGQFTSEAAAYIRTTTEGGRACRG